MGSESLRMILEAIVRWMTIGWKMVVMKNNKEGAKQSRVHQL